ncbi:hypothetical protein T484DRAFT_1760873 [Baffinella frigidus]|nr:hypothetical protein T484DRAFT_1760873 [Cryptophyta sp. CCMP2293]
MCRYFTLEIVRKLLVTQAMETTSGAENAIFILAIYATQFFVVVKIRPLRDNMVNLSLGMAAGGNLFTVLMGALPFISAAH